MIVSLYMILPGQGCSFPISSALDATWRVWLGYTGSVPTATSTSCATPATCWGGTVRNTLSSEWRPKSRPPGTSYCSQEYLTLVKLNNFFAIASVYTCRLKCAQFFFMYNFLAFKHEKLNLCEMSQLLSKVKGVLSCWCRESGGQRCLCRSRGSARTKLEVWRPGR